MLLGEFDILCHDFRGFTIDGEDQKGILFLFLSTRRFKKKVSTPLQFFSDLLLNVIPD